MSSPRGPKGLRDPNSRKAIRGGPGNTTTSKHAARPYVENSLVEKPFMTANSAAQKRTPKLGRLLIAIDLGTTRVAVATKEVLYNAPEDFKKSKEHLPRVFCHWPASSLSGDYRFPSTSIYYNRDGGLPITGNDLTLLVEDPSFEPQRLIRQLKMLFHDANKNATTLEMQARIEQQLQVVGKTSDEALHDLAQVVLEHLFHDTDGNGSELGKLYDHLERLDYELIIAVPPGRSTVDHARVRQAFVQGPIKSTAVFVESEPAAMFRSWVHDGQITRDWAVGKSFVIADIGGGTCCIVRLKLERLEPRLGFKQEFESQSIPFGAETISDAFLKKANSRVPEDWPDRDIELAKIRNRFESVYKRGFGRKPLNGMKMERTGTRNQWWEFSFDDLKACFDVCIKELVNGLEKEMKRGPMDYLVLGGGLADNHYVREYITNHFKGVKIRELSTGKEHVVVGSILARLDEDFIVDFPIVRSKAVTQWLPVTDEIEELSFYHRLAVKPSPTDPDAKYVMAAKWLVKKGTQGARVQNISSEDNIDDAKERHLHPNNKTPKFSETILTFNYDPGDDEWAFEVDGDDDIWVNQDGETIPSPEHEEKITWSPWSHEHSFEFNDLDDAKTENGGTPYKVLRYSIEMKVTETLTSTWAKIWSSEAMRKKNNSEIAFRSDPISLEPIFTAQNVSRSLKESFDMDNQARSARCGKENINAKQLAFKSQELDAWFGMGILSSCFHTYLFFSKLEGPWFNGIISAADSAPTMIGIGLSWWQSIIVIFLSQLIASVAIYFNSRVGAIYHIGFPCVARSVFGMWGSYYYVAARATLAQVWYGVQTYSTASLLDSMLRAIFGHSYTKIPNHIPVSQGITTRVMLCFFLIWACMLTLCSLRPYQLNKFFWAKSFLVTPAVVGLFVFCMVNTKGNLGPLYSSKTSGGGFGWFFMYAINAGMGNNATYITNQPDMTRWSKTLWGCRIPQIIINPITVTISATFGILSTAAINEAWGLELWNQWDLLNAILDRYWSAGSRTGVALCSFAWVFYFIGVNMSSNCLPFGSDATMLLPKFLTIPRGQYIGTFLIWAIVPWKILASASVFVQFLSGYGIFMASVASIMICDYYLLTKGNIFIGSLYSGDRSNKHYYYHKGWNVQALIAYICGVVVPFPGFVGTLGANVSQAATDIGHLGWLLSFTISFILYYAICYFWPTRNQRLVKELGLGWEEMATATETLDAVESMHSEPVEVVNEKETKM